MSEPVGSLGATVLDCAEPAELAAFWSTLLGGGVTDAGPEWAALRLPDGRGLGFQRVGRHRPPNRWRPQQLHLDVQVADLDAAVTRARELWARPVGGRRAGSGGPWQVLVDPAGHPFCLCAG